MFTFNLILWGWSCCEKQETILLHQKEQDLNYNENPPCLDFWVLCRVSLWFIIHGISQSTECNHWIYTMYKKHYFQGRFHSTHHILVICHTWECFINRRTAHHKYCFLVCIHPFLQLMVFNFTVFLSCGIVVISLFIALFTQIVSTTNFL